ncbi:MAG: hypothetical protein PHU25_05275 [Deltaproteobacteria bacterium]|nr:hypothetical protein [Deltaproteobacteria bacterium]
MTRNTFSTRIAPALAAGVSFLAALALAGCCEPQIPIRKAEPVQAAPEPALAPEPAPAPVAQASYPGIDRPTFNRLAVRLDLPVYWIADRNGNAAVDPDEVASLLFYPTEGQWVANGTFTPAFDEAWKRIEALSKDASQPAGLDAAEAERRRLVASDLDQGRPTLVYNDLTGLSMEDKVALSHLLAAARLTDELYMRQLGVDALASRIPAGDFASASLFHRNFGPRCEAPKTEPNPACSAIPGALKPLVDAYPAALQADAGFCASLEKREDSKALLDPFVVVRDEGGKLVSLSLPMVYKDRMEAIARELEAAANAIADAKEEALKAYLKAAAASYRSNDWLPADEAWSKMNATNSRWYVRVAPDETYWDPCSRKAGFHLTLARINPDSLAWQAKLVPVQQELEDAMATLIGRPYQARKVSFHMPDFVDIVLNAGNDRMPMGATMGQSLPNWGPVANEGRGRTVAMTNLYTDVDSLASRRAQAESLLTADTMTAYPQDQRASLMQVILHEATHNLGPSHEYKFGGRTDDQAFGGSLAATLEELKASTGALWYVDFLLKKGLIDDALARATYVDGLTWAMGHISRGMYTPDRKPKPYSQLAAVQVGFLMKEKAIVWDANATAANGGDRGAFTISFDGMPAAVAKLMKLVGAIKASNKKDKAAKLVRDFVDGKQVPVEAIAERYLREPKASFVYAFDM